MSTSTLGGGPKIAQQRKIEVSGSLNLVIVGQDKGNMNKNFN